MFYYSAMLYNVHKHGKKKDPWSYLIPAQTYSVSKKI